MGEIASVTELLVEAQQAMFAGALAEAERSFGAALEIEAIPDAHYGLAALAFLRGDYGASRKLLELAHRGYRDAQDLRMAVRTAIDLAGVHYDGFANESAAQGWLHRAERLLERLGRCVEQGYLALALVACHIRDAEALEDSAAFALELAAEFDDRDLEARALADGGLALVSKGQLAVGFARLDEAMAAVSAGEISPMVGSQIFCALLTACERTGDLRRAEEWTRACREFLDAHCAGVLPVLQAHCRIAYGVVLCDVGRWSEAEAELLQALEPSYGMKRMDAVAALAGLRLLQGRIEDAAEILAPHADRFETSEQMARLHLVRGEHELAGAVIARALDALRGDRLRSGRLLGLLVEAELARDNLDAAQSALGKLTAHAESSESVVLSACAKLAEGQVHVHRSSWAEAVGALGEASRILGDADRPILAARITVGLAEALAQMGDTAAAIAEARSALAIFERLGAGREADRVSALLRDLGASGRSSARGRDTSIASLTARERDVFLLLGHGLTNAEIAERLFITPKTAEHHVGRILSKLGVRSRTEVAAIASASSTPAL